ncbi:glycosyltransferase family 4 protein [Clostridium oceanicum]|uniref:Glycosyltransferase family 4 protein n=1 Tax=Clostridium oceanicum TaxID=1543 RepID=A0ABP3V3W4_9CLOT
MFNSKDILNKSIEKYVIKNKIDIVNFHGAKAFLLHKFLKRKLTVPTVATIHSDYRRDFLNNKVKYYLFTPLSVSGVKSFNNYICVSNYIKDLLIKDRFSGNKFVVNNGIDINKNNEISRKRIDDLKDELKIKSNDFVYIMIARMHPIKNHKLLIKAFNNLAKEYDNIKLLLLGDGEEKENIENQVKTLGIDKKVIFAGFKTNILDYLSFSNVSILTSFSEGGSPPLVILESALKKIPVIASKVGDIEEIVNGENGFLIDPKSCEDIYNKMKKCYLTKKKLDVLGNKLYYDVCNKYSIDKFCKAYYHCYNSIVNFGGTK